MDDFRLNWLMKQVNLALGLKHNQPFEDFLLHQNNEDDLNRFLSNSNPGSSGSATTAFFYKQETLVEVEEIVEVSAGDGDIKLKQRVRGKSKCEL